MTEKKPTNNQFLARIDERQQNIQKDIREIKDCLNEKVSTDIYQEHHKILLTTKQMAEENKSKIARGMAYIVGAATGGSILGSAINNLLNGFSPF